MVFAVLGVGMWVTDLVFRDSPAFVAESPAVSFTVIGLSMAAIAKVVGARQKGPGTDR